jgi:hypothetical protein
LAKRCSASYDAGAHYPIPQEEAKMSKKGGNKTSKAGPKPPMANKGPKKK